jgi:GTP-binding protein
MAFVDEITLHLASGSGGNGVVAWLHEKGKEFLGPSGGNGGKGGDVYFKAVRDLGRLASYRYGNVFAAERGGHGEGKSRHGKNGAALELEVPIGSVITNQKTGRVCELLSDGERIRVLYGGRGGFGNEHFKSSRNVRPKERTLGRAGEEADFHIELRLFADVGIIGLPNAGKSSLLNALTRAHAKVGSYAFTTLEPNLGALDGYILADIPGLIAGASEGKGLGVKFLKHTTRTKLLLHCISLESKDLRNAYETVRKELKAFSPELANKMEIIVFTKTDLVDDATVRKAMRKLEKKSTQVYAVSVIDDTRLTPFKCALLDILKNA